MEKEKTLLILKGAYQMEVEGAFYYDLLARNTKDIKAKEAYFVMMEEEVKHQEILMEQIQAVSENGQLDFSKISMSACPSGMGVFPKTFDSASTITESESSSLHIAILLEKNSFDYYQKAAEESTETEERSIYQNLAKWEKQHLDSLNSSYEMVRDQIWNDERFSPF
jgi:rubrerythrin